MGACSVHRLESQLPEELYHAVSKTDRQDGLQKTTHADSGIFNDVCMIMNSRKAQWISMGWMDGCKDDIARDDYSNQSEILTIHILFLSLSEYTGNQGLSR